MCKYIHGGEQLCCCILQSYFDLDEEHIVLPSDDSGMCIFHSENLDWKRNNNFSKYSDKLFEIISLIDEEKIIYEPPNEFLDIDLRGIKWIGQSNNSGSTENAVLIKDLNFNNYISLVFHGGHFYDPMIVKKHQFPIYYS